MLEVEEEEDDEACDEAGEDDTDDEVDKKELFPLDSEVVVSIPLDVVVDEA